MAVLLHQVVVRAGLHDAAFVEHEHPIGAAERAQAMGHDERGAAAHGAFHGGHNFVLRFRIDRGQGVVQNQNRRLKQNRSRDRQPLPLAAAKVRAVFADHGVVAFGQLDDEFMRRRDFGRPFDLLARGLADVQRRYSPRRYC